MRILVVAEHDGRTLRGASLSCLSFANSVAAATGGEVAWLVLGHRVENVAAEAARFAPVVVVDSPGLEQPMAEPLARTIAAVARRAELRIGLCRGVDVFERRVAASGGPSGRGDGQRRRCVMSSWTGNCNSIVRNLPGRLWRRCDSLDRRRL